MFNNDRFTRIATATFGALVLSTMTIAAAADTAQASTPQASWIGAAQFKAPASV